MGFSHILRGPMRPGLLFFSPTVFPGIHLMGLKTSHHCHCSASSCVCDLPGTVETSSETFRFSGRRDQSRWPAQGQEFSIAAGENSTFICGDWGQAVLGIKCYFAWLFSLHTNFPGGSCRERWLVNGIYNWFDCSWTFFLNIATISTEYFQILPTSSIHIITT